MNCNGWWLGDPRVSFKVSRYPGIVFQNNIFRSSYPTFLSVTPSPFFGEKKSWFPNLHFPQYIFPPQKVFGLRSLPIIHLLFWWFEGRRKLHHGHPATAWWRLPTLRVPPVLLELCPLRAHPPGIWFVGFDVSGGGNGTTPYISGKTIVVLLHQNTFKPLLEFFNLTKFNHSSYMREPAVLKSW